MIIAIIKLILAAIIVYALYNTYMPVKIKKAVNKRIKKVKAYFKKKYDKVKGYFKGGW